jgi:hypothetical protein
VITYVSRNDLLIGNLIFWEQQELKEKILYGSSLFHHRFRRLKSTGLQGNYSFSV